MKCNSCGFENNENVKYCGECGRSVSDNELIQAAENVENAPRIKEKRRGGCLKWMLIIIGIIVGLSVLGSILSTESEPTSTVDKSKINIEQFKNEAKKINYADLARTPKDFTDQKVVITGEVIQVIESGNEAQYRINVTKNDFSYSDTVFVTYVRDKDESRILEDDIVTFYGLSKGLISYESTLGGKITIPHIDAVLIEQSKK